MESRFASVHFEQIIINVSSVSQSYNYLLFVRRMF